MFTQVIELLRSAAVYDATLGSFVPLTTLELETADRLFQTAKEDLEEDGHPHWFIVTAAVAPADIAEPAAAQPGYRPDRRFY